MTHGGKREGAGRKKGVPNKKSMVVQEILDSLNCDPVKNLVSIAKGEPQETLIYLNKETGEYIVDKVPPTIDLRTKANTELLQYIYPKLKSVEHKGENGGPIVFGWAKE